MGTGIRLPLLAGKKLPQSGYKVGPQKVRVLSIVPHHVPNFWPLALSLEEEPDHVLEEVTV